MTDKRRPLAEVTAWPFKRQRSYFTTSIEVHPQKYRPAI